MEAKMLERKYFIAVRLDPGDEVISSLEKACEENNIRSGIIIGLGAMKKAVVITKASPEKIRAEFEELEGPIEMSVAHGNVSVKDGKPFIHLHASISLLPNTEEGGKGEARTLNTHLKEGVISLTGEFFILETGEIGREFNDKIGMHTWSF